VIEITQLLAVPVVKLMEAGEVPVEVVGVAITPKGEVWSTLV
jgi:hypothetical protein